eukprot:jgi/Botrbrau1/15217/Bobra.0149s0072.1
MAADAGPSHFVEFQPMPSPPLRNTFRQASEDALDLLARMMAYDPSRRISAADALKHRYFRAEPAATPPTRLPRPPVKANFPLQVSGVGGSAIQEAVAGEAAAVPMQNGSTGPSANIAGGLAGSEVDGSSGLGDADGYPPRPKCDVEDLRYLRKRKLFMDEAMHLA